MRRSDAPHPAGPDQERAAPARKTLGSRQLADLAICAVTFLRSQYAP
jgi:hypothetical protein